MHVLKSYIVVLFLFGSNLAFGQIAIDTVFVPIAAEAWPDSCDTRVLDSIYKVGRAYFYQLKAHANQKRQELERQNECYSYRYMLHCAHSIYDESLLRYGKIWSYGMIVPCEAGLEIHIYWYREKRSSMLHPHSGQRICN